MEALDAPGSGAEAATGVGVRLASAVQLQALLAAREQQGFAAHDERLRLEQQLSQLREAAAAAAAARNAAERNAEAERREAAAAAAGMCEVRVTAS